MAVRMPLERCVPNGSQSPKRRLELPIETRIELSEEGRSELEHRAACYSRPHRELQRAKLVFPPLRRLVFEW
jgi:hypothetical protein